MRGSAWNERGDDRWPRARKHPLQSKARVAAVILDRSNPTGPAEADATKLVRTHAAVRQNLSTAVRSSALPQLSSVRRLQPDVCEPYGS